MTVPKKWTPGEPITAERLNTSQAEAMRSRRDINLGQGSSAVYEALGNQSADMRQPLLKLMIATEDFAIPDGRTDLAVGPDDVPSGMCVQIRLSRYDSVHREEIGTFPERVWDALGGLNGTALRQCGEVFYVVFNQDSKRWEVLQNINLRLITAVVNVCLGDGWHEVEITDWNGEPTTTGSASVSVSASGSDDGECDLCSLIDTVTDTACVSIQSVSVDRDTGTPTGETVYAHTTRLMPMMVGGMIKMIKRTATATGCGSASASASASASVSDDIFTDRLYDVVDGVWPLLALPFPNYACCTDPVSGVETVELISCSHAIVEGYDCALADTPCPDSASASASV